jgi:hypothetical protein
MLDPIRHPGLCSLHVILTGSWSGIPVFAKNGTDVREIVSPHFRGFSPSRHAGPDQNIIAFTHYSLPITLLKNCERPFITLTFAKHWMPFPVLSYGDRIV